MNFLEWVKIPRRGERGCSPISHDRDVPPVRPGFCHYISLKAGLDSSTFSVKAGQHNVTSVKGVMYNLCSV